ncbi:MAG TPA: hypothetical protein VEA59_04200 [Patescibacteria group bacterium]|nr:hypothetical protein [Patescibacteria group bacterium]
MATQTQKICLQCGPDTVNHPLEYMAVLMDQSVTPMERLVLPSMKVARMFKLYKITPYFLEALAKVKIATVLSHPEKDEPHRSEVMWEEALKRGINVKKYRIFNLPTQTFTAKYKNHYFAFDALPRPHHLPREGMLWMDDKYRLKLLLQKSGLPTARGGMAFSLRTAKKMFDSLSKPVICKPRLGSRSRHTTLNITDKQKFIEAFKSAKQICPWVMIEESLTGPVHRATVIAGKCAGVVRREVAGAVADGVHTVRELLEIENKNPKRIIPIHVTEITPEILAEQGLTWESVPEQGRFVNYSRKTSRGQGGRVITVTPQTHPDNIKLFEDIADAVKDSLVGIDFMIDNISKSWKEQPTCGTLEINALPFIDLHHFPTEGEIENVAGALWDAVIPESVRIQD